MPGIDLTVLMAIRGAEDAARLTLSSLSRSRPLPGVVVGDNGCSPALRARMAELPWVTVVPADTRGDGDAREDVRQHARTLDDLAAMVRTRWFVTLDSDVEILDPGWFGAVVDEAVACRVVAMGEWEPPLPLGSAVQMPRLAPHALLLYTAAHRALATSFRGRAEIVGTEQAQRFLDTPRGPAYRLTVDEAARFPDARFYSTAAVLFEELQRWGLPWAETPVGLRRGYRHLQHMSWGAGHADLAGRVERAARHARERLLTEPGCPVDGGVSGHG